MPEIILLQSELYRTSVANLEAAIAKRDEEINELREKYEQSVVETWAKHAPAIQSIEELMTKEKMKMEQLQQKQVKWAEDIINTDVSSYTSDDVEMALHRARIAFDGKIIAANQVTGEIFVACDTEDVVRSVLGVSLVGDCVRVVKIVTHLQQGPGLNPVSDIMVDDHKDQIRGALGNLQSGLRLRPSRILAPP